MLIMVGARASPSVEPGRLLPVEEHALRGLEDALGDVLPRRLGKLGEGVPTVGQHGVDRAPDPGVHVLGIGEPQLAVGLGDLIPIDIGEGVFDGLIGLLLELRQGFAGHGPQPESVIVDAVHEAGSDHDEARVDLLAVRSCQPGREALVLRAEGLGYLRLPQLLLEVLRDSPFELELAALLGKVVAAA